MGNFITENFRSLVNKNNINFADCWEDSVKEKKAYEVLSESLADVVGGIPGV